MRRSLEWKESLFTEQSGKKTKKALNSETFAEMLFYLTLGRHENLYPPQRGRECKGSGRLGGKLFSFYSADNQHKLRASRGDDSKFRTKASLRGSHPFHSCGMTHAHPHHRRRRQHQQRQNGERA
jgi:hypothetical protein